MRRIGQLAAIGSGPSAIFFLKHLLDEIHGLMEIIDSVTIFEKDSEMGFGMPFSPQTTDRFNLSDISSDEIPELTETLYEWLSSRSDEQLAEWDLSRGELSEQGVYARLALGEYLHQQFIVLTRGLEQAGLKLTLKPAHEVTDLQVNTEDGRVAVLVGDATCGAFDTVIIASGHCWQADERRDQGLFASPWPIPKLLPARGELYDFPIGILGASLSAFDVVSSLAHRHGQFRSEADRLVFELNPSAKGFCLVLHAAHGLLPHLQWDQDEPRRRIYRHVDREHLLGRIDKHGFLRIAAFFDTVCKPTLRAAFAKDEQPDMVALLQRPGFSFEDFVEEMTERHEYVDSFEGMRQEMVKARESVERQRPIHWKEVLDDLMYCLNFHAELMPAEDQRLFRNSVMPFLMNVMAAMPLASGEILLALYQAGVIKLVKGRVEVDAVPTAAGCVGIRVDNEGALRHEAYRLFVDCTGQAPVEVGDYPFPALVADGYVREARAKFADPHKALSDDAYSADDLRWADEVPYLRTGGVEVDAVFRLISEDGQASSRVHDLSFPHTSGVRPYSYGLQACDATAAIVVRSWVEAHRSGQSQDGRVQQVSRFYQDL